MNVNIQPKKLYDYAIKHGGRINDKGIVFRDMLSKNKKTKINQIVYPNGNYSMMVVDNKKIVKYINKKFFSGNYKSSHIFSWDRKSDILKFIAIVVESSRSYLERTIKKIGDKPQSGTIKRYIKNNRYPSSSVCLQETKGNLFPAYGKLDLYDKFIERFRK